MREPFVGRQLLEQLYNPLEIQYRLGAFGAARRQAGRPQGAVASPVASPLMLEDREQLGDIEPACHTSQKRSFSP